MIPELRLPRALRRPDEESEGAPNPRPQVPPASLAALVERFDASVFDAPSGRARIRLTVLRYGEWDALFSGDRVHLEQPRDREPDAILSADLATWNEIAADLGGVMDAYRAGRLTVRRNLHLGVGFLAATGGSTTPDRLRFGRVETPLGRLSLLEAGSGDPVVLLHGLGATKASFLPTVSALAYSHRMIALDLPGFGDSVKPFRASYDAGFFARTVVEVLDALGIERADVVGNSMGGRVALEMGLSHPDRTGRLALLAPSLTWRRKRGWAPYVRLLRPELGLLQPAPRGAVEPMVRRLVPGASDGWSAAGVDEFLRSYLTPRGRAAFYAAARQIYLEDPDGPEGVWSRLGELRAESLFVWGRKDAIVPIGFAAHVRRELPSARHLELDCGHVPQLERPVETHDAIAELIRTPVAA